MTWRLNVKTVNFLIHSLFSHSYIMCLRVCSSSMHVVSKYREKKTNIKQQERNEKIMKTLRCSQYVIRLVFAIMALCSHCCIQPIAHGARERAAYQMKWKRSNVHFFLRVHKQSVPKSEKKIRPFKNSASGMRDRSKQLNNYQIKRIRKRQFSQKKKNPNPESIFDPEYWENPAISKIIFQFFTRLAWCRRPR